jgi:hypothetical protein
LTFLGIAEKNDLNRASGSQARTRAAAYAAKAKRAGRPAPGV